MKLTILFVIFLISAAAMDSDIPAIPGAICLCSILLLMWSSRNEISKKKEPAATGSINETK